jgi:hypothetical protein
MHGAQIDSTIGSYATNCLEITLKTTEKEKASR